MKRSVNFDKLDIAEFVDFVTGITHRNKFTQEEKSAIQLKVELLYDKYVIQTQEEDSQAQSQRQTNAGTSAQEGGQCL